ncbi:hypothetical protein TeGR_g2224 [Tetraparma gracilis]|uniref:Uncharacterized protein n=1 Tax=Tetraparma gracilis TaxID=2962635 RepID=A0ABQ6N4W4_9STRA|nr:hypothetical protein TeGR_g2224 [Tetraparma gracilis]
MEPPPAKKTKVEDPEAAPPAPTAPAPTAPAAASPPPPASASTSVSSSSPAALTSTPADVLQQLDLHTGSRVVVMWDLESEGGGSFTETWWGASILPYAAGSTYELRDDETGDVATVPMHTLRYDANELLGYPEATESDVVFLSEHLIFDVGLQMTSVFKKEGSAWLPSDVDLTEAQGAEEKQGKEEKKEEAVVIGSTRAEYEDFFDAMFASSFASVQSMYSGVSGSSKMAVAEIFAKSRTEIVDSLWNKTQGMSEVTTEVVQEIIAEVGERLAAIKAEVFANSNMTNVSRA